MHHCELGPHVRRDSSPALESPASTDRPRETARVFLIGGNWKDCVWTAVAEYVSESVANFPKTWVDRLQSRPLVTR